ncbi:MAG: hypothetical protein N2C14_15780, partial [Planctomycetales bacterium]
MRLRNAISPAGLLFLAWSFCCPGIFAQDPPVADAEESPAREEKPPVEEAETRLFYLPDEKGVLQPVPNFTLEDFDRMLRLDTIQANRAPQPRFVIDSLVATGEATETHATITVNADVTTQHDDWVRIPLRLHEAILRKFHAAKPVRHLLESTEEGYVFWIRARPNQRVKITLELLVRVESTAGQHGLKLSIPRATRSRLSLTVPVSQALGRAAAGKGILEASFAEGKKTRLQFAGVEGPLEITWWKPNQRTTRSPAVLDSRGQVRARVEGNTLQFEATLTVSS